MKNLQSFIKSKAKEKPRKILLIEGEDSRIIKAASMAFKDKICKPVLLGSPKAIKKISAKNKINLNGVEILDYKIYPKLGELSQKLYELRKHKGLSPKEARELLSNPNYFGALMLKLGKCDGAVGGCKYSTAEWMRPVFQVVGKKQGVSIVSAVSFAIIKGKVYFFSDTDFVIMPNSEELAQIAINANDFVKSLGIEPKVALLSYSTKGSGEHSDLEFIRNALAIVKKKRSDIIIDGELQLDAAINPNSAKRKCPDSVLKGEANVLIFPNITVGNVLIHSLMQWTNYKFFGSFAVGLEKPVANGGRGMNAQQIYDIISVCGMMRNL